MAENPFEVLRLDPATPVEEALRHAERRIREAVDEPLRQRLWQAVGELSASPDQAALAALLTHPAPGYASVDIASFIERYGKPPAGAPELGPPPFDEREFRRRLLEAIAGELDPGPAELEPLPITEAGGEVSRQTAEAMWQALLSDMRA